MSSPSQFTSVHPPRRFSGWGVTALSLGFVGLLLFFWQPLGAFISFCGLLSGILGIIVAFIRDRVGLPYALAGTFFCAIALGINVLIWFGGMAHFTRPY